MSIPRFAQYLPSGKLLDWAYTHIRRDETFDNTPGLEALKTLWDDLTDDNVAQIAAKSENPEVLDWIVAHGRRHQGVRAALLRNPSLPFTSLLSLLERGMTAADREAIGRARGVGDLSALLLEGYSVATSPKQAATWLGAGLAGDPRPGALTCAIRMIEEEHLPTLLGELLRADVATSSFPLEPVLTALEENPADAITENIWHQLGGHLAGRGTGRQHRRALRITNSPALRAPLLETGAITIEQAYIHLTGARRVAVLRQLTPERLITADEIPHVAALYDGLAGDPSGTSTLEALHGLRYTPEAIAWALEHADERVAGALAWHAESDAALIRALRRNRESHRWAAGHIWRAGRIWGRLAQRTRHQIIGTLDGMALSNLAPGPIRTWILEQGPTQAVGALTLRKTELRTLMDRAERANDGDLAWMAAHNAERPRDRIRMAEIGLTSPRWPQEMRRWLRAASSGEIIKLWQSTDETRRGDMGALLVANIRSSDDHSWVDRIVGEIRLDWQSAPTSFQEAAALWLAGRVGDKEETWSALWALYPEWSGTLPELLEAAETL